MSPRRCDIPRAPARSGMTLIELMVAASVMSLVAVVLAGIVTALDTARSHVEGLHEATALGRFAVGRIHDAVNRTGTYRIGTNETVPGIAVVANDDRPEILVLWTGGRETSLAETSPLARLPRANELVIVTSDPADPRQLIELVVPTATDNVDFTASTFATRVRQLIGSTSAEKVTLCDRTRVLRWPATESGAVVAAVRFEWEASPSSSQIAATTPGTAEWRALPWAGGVSTSNSGLRQIALRIELQVVNYGAPAADVATPSLPVFGSAVRRYLHRKG